jgi:hypothetical protein
MAKLLGGTRIYGNANVDSILYVNGGIASTSNSTGSIVVSGGVGVTGSLYTGNVAVVGVNPLIGFTGNASVISTGRELVFGVTGDEYGSMLFRMQNRTGQNGPLFDGGGLGVIDFSFLTSSVQRNIRYETRPVGGTILGSPFAEFQFGLAGNPSFVMNDNIVLVNPTTASTSNSTGAFRVNGGAGIKGNVYSGGIYITGTGNGITFVDGTVQTTNSASYGFSVASFAAANTAAGNTVYLQGGLNTANANIALLIAVNASQNTLISTANTLAQAAYNTANNALANTGFSWSLQGTTGVGQTYTIVFRSPMRLTITETATQCDSGSDIATIKIDGTAIGGATHAVTSSIQAIARSSSNIVSVANNITITFQNSGAVNPVVSIRGVKG